MKKALFVLVVSVLIQNLSADEGRGLYLESISTGGAVKVPVSHYSGFSWMETGAAIQFNYRYGNLDDLRLFWGLDGTYNFNGTPRIDHLVDTSLTLGVGWEINPGKGKFTLTPQISGGVVLHILYGDFMLDGNRGTTLYLDQLYRFQLEAAWTLKSGSENKSLMALFISPSFEVFPGEEYWGYIPGGTAGIRMRF